MGTDQLADPDDHETVTMEEYRRLAKGRQVRVVTPQPKRVKGKKPKPRTPQGFRCRACGEKSTSLAAAERHAEATGHARIECV